MMIDNIAIDTYNIVCGNVETVNQYVSKDVMRNIKFEFILKDECVGGYAFGKLVYTLEYLLDVGISNDYIIEQATEQFSPANGMDSEFKIIANRQYTGLKDKNGVEIYEGDIVTHTDFNLPSEVTFEIGCFRIHNFTIANFDAIHHMGRIEVIGNIYENPELLKGIKNDDI